MSLSAKAWAWAGFSLRGERGRLEISEGCLSSAAATMLNLHVTQEDQAKILGDYFTTLCASDCF